MPAQAPAQAPGRGVKLARALASVVAMPDLLKQATQAQALAANPSPLIAAALIYLAFLWPVVLVVGHLERRLGARAGAGR